MKEFQISEINIQFFAVEDVITISLGDNETPGSPV